nr:uncharacterized protein LOC129381498 isoform X2 [Dermacentor andersoni]
MLPSLGRVTMSIIPEGSLPRLLSYRVSSTEQRHLAMHLYWEAIDEERGAKVEEKAEPLDHQQLLDKADLDAGRRPLDEAEERRETCGQLPGKRRKADGVRGTSRPLTRSYRNMILRKRIKREH